MGLQQRCQLLLFVFRQSLEEKVRRIVGMYDIALPKQDQHRTFMMGVLNEPEHSRVECYSRHHLAHPTS